ncbi:MAG: hypothetical protein M2R45_00570 [Verrucomicrobia subdivision 3 bacterium]|nr:hypothetical protein [Limisphaerales bacterium]MCS1413553.1 hypothetical protein [Limisphaerales bacterium]
MLDQGIISRLCYLGKADNHGANGLNSGHCHGHVDWSPRKDYIYLYELSEDEGQTEMPRL